MNIKSRHFIEKEVSTALPINSHYRPTKGSNSDLMGSFVIATNEENRLNFIHGSLTPKIKNWFSGFNNYDAKEELYITAVGNLLKKVDYLHLTMQLDQNLIDEDEFDKELENEDKYLIKMNDSFKSIDFNLVLSITNKLKNRNFSSDEISELFSIEVEKIEDYIDHTNNYLLK